MPITSLGSYIPTMEEFHAHWLAVNALNPGAPLTLPNAQTSYYPPAPYDVNAFAADQNAIVAIFQTVTALSQMVRLKAATLEAVKAPMRERVTQFRMTAQLNRAASPFLKDIPKTPSPSSIESKFVAPLDSLATVWAAMNNTGQPLLLPGNYALPQWNVDVAALRAAYTAARNADEAANLKRAERDALLAPMYERLKQYRTAVVLFLPAGSALLQTVPKLSPPPGTTPPGLEVTGIWNPPTGNAQFSWPASTFPEIDKIQVRGCTGGTWKNGEEVLVDDLPATATNYQTTWGLTVPGAIATFKFFVMTTTGNENGGKAVKITRPTT